MAGLRHNGLRALPDVQQHDADRTVVDDFRRRDPAYLHLDSSQGIRDYNITILKLLLIFILPFLLFLLALNSFAFNGGFYKKEFSKLGIDKTVPNASLLHRQVIDFLKGNGALPDDFNEREKSHLYDVKKLAKNSGLLMYFFIALLVLLIFVSARIIGNNKYSMNFIGEALLYGGILSIITSAALLFSSQA